MKNRKDDGVVFGNPEIRTVQKSGTRAAKEKSDAIVREIVDFLKMATDASVLLRKQVIEHLNVMGVRTLQGRDWDITRVTIPLRKARALLTAEAEEELRALRNTHDFARF